MESFHAYLDQLQGQKKKPKSASYQIFKMTSPVFTTKGKKFDPGQYLIPFSFRIPSHAPGSFSYVSHQGERFGVEYSVKVSFTKIGEGALFQKKVFPVREYLFTDQEVMEVQAEEGKISKLESAILPRNRR